MGRITTAVVVSIVVIITAGIYAIWAYQTGQASCSGYPPGGNCLGNYSYTFAVSVNYAGSWRATYYGYHSTGAPSGSFDSGGNYTGGVFAGTGSGTQEITLSGPNTNGLTLCIQARKLDSSTATISLGIGSRSSNSSIPFGMAQVCLGVVP
jgi:hypothetical protein